MATTGFGPGVGAPGGTVGKSAFGVAGFSPSPEPEPEPGPEVWSSGQSMAPQLIRGVGVRGTVFSVQFRSDENGTPWTVHRLVNHMRARRNPSVTRTEVKG